MANIEHTANTTNLEPRIFPRVESIHATEALTGWSATQQVYVASHWQTLSGGVRLVTLIDS